MKTAEEIMKEIIKTDKIISKMIETSVDKYKNYNEFEIALAPYQRDIRNLERELRMVIPCKSDGAEITEDDHVMTVAQFIEDVKSGCLIDYDGWGYYIKNNKRTNILVFLSDVKYNAIRKEFDTIIWLNK